MSKPDYPSPPLAIRKHCEIDCFTNSCTDKTCDLYEYRLLDGKGKSFKPLDAIRQHCFWCRGSWVKIKECVVKTCYLHIYRSGHTPRSKHYWV